MPKGLFPRFVRALGTAWETSLPRLTRVSQSYGPSLPKASTFYAGCEVADGKHVFVNLQHNAKSWKTGQFTANLVLSNVLGAPASWRLGHRAEFDRRLEGSYRVGSLVHGKDKWWCLTPTEPSRLVLAWQPSSYQDEDVVFREAIEDVSADIGVLLRELAGRPIELDTN
jgi:hypothetical protein